MNKADLIEALATRVGGRAVAALAVESLVDVVLREVAAGGAVGITGFGTFERVDRAARTGRNPRTGAPVPIAATSLPRFRPGAYFKDVVADPSTLPEEGLAGVRVGSTGELVATTEPDAPRGSRAPAQGAGRASIRRSAGDAATTKDPVPAKRAKEARPAAADDPTKPGRRTRTSGTPDTVRAPRPPAENASGEQARPAAPSPRRRPMTSGEEITAGMISAKKAQLAQVKNDEIAAKEKKAKKKAKDKDPEAAPGKAKKGKGKKKK
ncbi:HU family DNA-binding protein [Ornithinimicrobium sp. LYQ121]|uniref:HU family DNA-binding protein n=1 Tax=Ornithinimicrobium sp. LYQ121 TaxID=3378801 RepID=UPI003853DD5C